MHLFGNVAPVAEIEALGVPVLEDAAQAAGSAGPAGRPGALGTIATFSFYPSKNLGAFGDGGAIATNDAALADAVRTLRFHGSQDKVTYTQVGYNSRLDELQAAVLRVELPELDRWAAHRHDVGEWYAQAGLGELARCRRRRRARAPRGTSTSSATSAPTSSRRRWPPATSTPAATTARPCTASPRWPNGAPASSCRSPTSSPARTSRSRSPRRSRAIRSTRSSAPCAMRVWIDLTNSPHVLVMRPVIEVLRARGDEVRVTARDFAQTVALCERFGIEREVIGRHRGSRLAAKALGLVDRSAGADALGARQAASTSRWGTAPTTSAWPPALLRIPCSTMFDYEWATVQHNVNCRLAQAVVVPEAIPPERLYRYGARHKLRRYPGLKEEYYLADFEPDPAVLTSWASIPRSRSPWCARRRRSRSTTASRTTCSPASCSGCAARRPWCCRGWPRSGRSSTGSSCPSRPSTHSRWSRSPIS